MIYDIGVSGFGAQLFCKLDDAVIFTYPIEDFAPESDMITVEEIETGAMACTPDGRALKWTKIAPISVSLKLSPVSVAGNFLMQQLTLQTRIAGIQPVMATFNLLTWRPKVKVTYLDGTLISGTPVETIGADRVADTSFKLNFLRVQRVPLP